MMRHPSSWMIETVFSLIVCFFILAVGWELFQREMGVTPKIGSKPASIPKTTAQSTVSHEDRLALMELRLSRLEKTLAEKTGIRLSRRPQVVPDPKAPRTATPEPTTVPGMTPPSRENASPTDNHNADIPSHPRGYFVAVGCYGNPGYAHEFRDRLRNRGFSAYEKQIRRKEDILLCVFVGPIDTETQAKDLATVLASNHGAIGPLIYPYPNR
ncbi:MAG: Sporulation related domain [Magnetococcales bacterium]|nr:Sporulation related domain [Magnetococcales bacterium]